MPSSCSLHIFGPWVMSQTWERWSRLSTWSRKPWLADDEAMRRWALTPLIPMELVPTCFPFRLAAGAACRGTLACMPWRFTQSPKAVTTYGLMFRRCLTGGVITSSKELAAIDKPARPALLPNCSLCDRKHCIPYDYQIPTSDLLDAILWHDSCHYWRIALTHRWHLLCHKQWWEYTILLAIASFVRSFSEAFIF